MARQCKGCKFAMTRCEHLPNTPETPKVVAARWARPGCPICPGTGYLSDGEACIACLITTLARFERRIRELEYRESSLLGEVRSARGESETLKRQLDRELARRIHERIGAMEE